MLAFLDVSGLEKALGNVKSTIEDQDKSLKSLATRLVSVERIANKGKDTTFEDKVLDLEGRMLAAEEFLWKLESKTEGLDDLRHSVKSMEEKLTTSLAEMQSALKTGIHDTRAHVDEQIKRLRNELQTAETKVSEAVQRFETLQSDVEDCALVTKQQGKKLDEVEETASLAVAHSGLIADIRQRQDTLKEVFHSEFDVMSTKVRVKADQASLDIMRSDLEQSNLAMQKRIGSVTDVQDKLHERAEKYAKHLEGHDSTLETLHAEIQALKNIRIKSGGAAAAGTAHCLSCYGQRTQSPPRFQRGADGATYHADPDQLDANTLQRGIQIAAGRVKPPRTVPSIPSANREVIPQASPYEAQRRALASAAEKANWSKTTTPSGSRPGSAPSGSRPGSATIPGTGRSRLSRPGTAQSYHSLNSDRSLPLLERIDFTEPSGTDPFVSDDGADPPPPGF